MTVVHYLNMSEINKIRIIGRRLTYSISCRLGVFFLFYSKSKKGGTPVDFNYFYGRGADQFAFYQIPKILITDEKFAGITMESKILYSLMLDRASFSAKNGWLDEDGKVFIYYKLDRIMADMHCANQKATMTVNQEGAKIVQYIFNRYVSGVGTSTIARELEEMGVPNPSGSKTWHQTTVAGIIRNEKYVGDLLQGKTFTVDPISHRRLDNLGESDKYLMKDHHEAIVSREVFDKAQEILAKRGKCHSNARLRKDEYRTLYTNKYAFSCKCRCGYWTLSDSELEKNVYIQKYDDESFKEMHKSYCLDAKITEDNFNKSKKIAKFLEEHPEYKDKSINEICLEAGGQNLLFQIVCLQHSLQNKDMRKEVIINKHENIYPELFPLDE